KYKDIFIEEIATHLKGSSMKTKFIPHSPKSTIPYVITVLSPLMKIPFDIMFVSFFDDIYMYYTYYIFDDISQTGISMLSVVLSHSLNLFQLIQLILS